MRLHIYVPTEKCHAHILPGSGIVGVELEGPRRQVLIHFEGNRYGSENIKTWEDKLLHAAGRLVERYPTIAFAVVDRDAVRAVGIYETDTWSVVERWDHNDAVIKKALNEWLTPTP